MSRLRARRGRWPGDPKPATRKKSPASKLLELERRRADPELAAFADALRSMLGLCPLQRHRRGES